MLVWLGTYTTVYLRINYWNTHLLSHMTANTNSTNANGSNGASNGSKPAYKAVVFDMGGVIVRYREPELYRRFTKLCRRYTLAPLFTEW